MAAFEAIRVIRSERADHVAVDFTVGATERADQIEHNVSIAVTVPGSTADTIAVLQARALREAIGILTGALADVENPPAS